MKFFHFRLQLDGGGEGELKTAITNTKKHFHEKDRGAQLNFIKNKVDKSYVEAVEKAVVKSVKPGDPPPGPISGGRAFRDSYPRFNLQELKKANKDVEFDQSGNQQKKKMK